MKPEIARSLTSLHRKAWLLSTASALAFAPCRSGRAYEHAPIRKPNLGLLS